MTVPNKTLNLSFAALKQAYRSGELSPQQLVEQIIERAAGFTDHNIWITAPALDWIQPYIDGLASKNPDSSPLWGIPFVIKDNIDLAGVPTTAGCPQFAYTPGQHAFVVQQLVDAGAIPVGKANLDQFATGLNGTRSPFGACHNSFDFDYVSGGSSSGSAVSVALGLASFSLGTDTAGSGRVPACFNNLIGLKPSIGLLSGSGLVYACRSLDCISIFATNSDDANEVLEVAAQYDEADGFSRHNPYLNLKRHYGLAASNLSLGVIPPSQLQFFGDEGYASAYADTLSELQAAGFTLTEIDFEPFLEAARLLYEGPWVTERYMATQPLIDTNPDAIFPVVRAIVEQGKYPAATDLFKAQYRLRELKRTCDAILASVDALLTPTAGRHFTIAEMLAEPIKANSQLGYYTNFMNLLDMASVAVPTRLFSAANGKTMPFGITLVGPCMSDRWLLSIANRLQGIFELPQGATGQPQPARAQNPVTSQKRIDVLVCGAHLTGLPLNWQLTERGATLKTVTTTAAVYRMYALAGGPLLRPGLIRDESNGAAIDVEIWSMPADQFGTFVAAIPGPLGIGKVQIADGSMVTGFICEPSGQIGAEDITHHGSWKAWLASR
ncbi:allophanate hydrolase [Parathalassolituus penaei]|uniref:Allophanate hydrolase n=1 Tax=Parathalassolituus penaei TaxID=2997323 RepID=A0A9X3IV22_9GAMM|nr:allophanate hydrolase [Parathalassolituus penaei]MCY0966788.1 allophanate hydrolase [Parathalassolituus penaei]